MNEQVQLKIRNLCKKYDEKVVINNLSFDVYKGEFLSILGSSGCGKTTLIRMLIGIEKPSSGTIYLDEEEITNFVPSMRKMGIVFQNYALFPNMTVYKNIAYALKCRHLPKKEVNQRVREIIQKVGLEEHMNKKPSKLSGGQCQRVAIARTLVLNPDIILFDEPMAALDAQMRMQLREEIKNLQKEFNMTMIYITHDQEEAFALSDRIMVMNKGNIEQLATPKEIYHFPKTPYIQEFVIWHLNEKIKSIQENI